MYPLLKMVFSNMALRCDIASNSYKHTDASVFETIRPDFLVLDHYTELIAIEVKPFNTSQSLIEEDEVRVAELSKKILHMRMAMAKTVKEFCSFGICIAGDNMNLYKHEYNNGQYIYTKLDDVTLPTMRHTYTHIQLSLEALFGFKNLVLATLPTQEEMMLPYLANVTAMMEPTTLYLL